MRKEQGPGCPFDKFRPCRGAGCVLYTQLRGTHPQTGQELDEHGCALAWGPVLLVEAAKETRQAAAATESLRNAVLVQGQAGRAVLLHAAKLAGGALDQAGRAVLLHAAKLAGGALDQAEGQTAALGGAAREDEQ